MNSKFRDYSEYKKLDENEMLTISEKFKSDVKRRRTVRDFSSEDIPLEIIKNCIEAAGSAPSGANKQPWTFVIVKNREVKKEIRILAEKEEREFYGGKAPDEWLKDLEQFETNAEKPFLEKAPYLVAIFERKYEIENGEKHKNYYTKESVGLAAGILITALNKCGIATLTHTPSPMNFLNKILNRPENEKPFLLLVAGYPADNIKIPDVKKKSFDEIAVII